MSYEKICVNCTRYGSYGEICANCVNVSNFTLFPGLVKLEQPLDNTIQFKEDNVGQKFDHNKADWTLMPWKELEQVLEILEFGVTKYSRDNWKHVEPHRYEKAAMRHLISYATGEKLDQESGKSHLAHLICNALFLLYNDNKSTLDKKA